MTFVGVCGGRDYCDALTISIALDEHVEYGAVIVHGGARGADSFANAWAVRCGHGTLIAPAHWSRGKGAGHARNAIIAALPLAKLIAFPGGNGTADMVRRARSAGIPVVEVSP